MKILTRVLTGSRLHNLNNDKSDYDWRGVHLNDLKEVLSPFKTVRNTSWIEGDEDNTSYELADFCKMAVKGNATILEVFFSNRIEEDSDVARKMRLNWRKFMDTDQFVMASRGYTANQYNKMQLFEPDKRTPKFAVAYCRVLWQCAEFLKTGEFKCQVEGPARSFLLEVKYEPFNDKMVAELTEMFMRLQHDITNAYKNTKYLIKPDISWIEEFIYDAYISNN